MNHYYTNIQFSKVAFLDELKWGNMFQKTLRNAHSKIPSQSILKRLTAVYRNVFSNSTKAAKS